MPDIKTPKMLQALPPEKMQEVNVMLMEHRRPATVSRIIHEDWGLLEDVTRASLSRIIARHRATNITELDILEHNGASKIVAKAEEKLQGQFKVLDEYQYLIAIQKARIAAGVNIEGTMAEGCKGVPSRQVTSDIMAMNTILASYANIGLKVGLLRTMTPDEAEQAMRGVMVGDLAETVLTDGDLKSGLMSLIGNVLEDVRASDEA